MGISKNVDEVTPGENVACVFSVFINRIEIASDRLLLRYVPTHYENRKFKVTILLIVYCRVTQKV